MTAATLLVGRSVGCSSAFQFSCRLPADTEQTYHRSLSVGYGRRCLSSLCHSSVTTILVRRSALLWYHDTRTHERRHARASLAKLQQQQQRQQRRQRRQRNNDDNEAFERTKPSNEQTNDRTNFPLHMRTFSTDSSKMYTTTYTSDIVFNGFSKYSGPFSIPLNSTGRTRGLDCGVRSYKLKTFYWFHLQHTKL